jgi:hypothetical protein
MAQRHDVRIPPRRLRLLAIFLVYTVSAVLGGGATAGLLSALLHRQTLWLTPLFLIFLVGTLAAAGMAVWALVYLALNLPALQLTPTALINHSVIWHVVVPWQEIEEFTYFPSSANPKQVKSIIVSVKDQRRLDEHQWLLTRVLCRLFTYMRPLAINTAMTSHAPEQVVAQLERYVRATFGVVPIKFTAIGRPRSGTTHPETSTH